MAGFYRDLVALLREAGCYHLQAGKGDHEIWFSPITGQPFTVDHGCKSKHTANGTLKAAGLDKAF